jgi:hypothetical protein
MTTPDNTPVTAESARATLEAGGNRCPRCRLPDVTAWATEFLEDAQYQEMACPACGVQWTNVWELARLLVYGQGDNPDTFVMPAAPASAAASLPKVRTDPDLWTQQADGSWQKTYDPRTLGQVWEDIARALPAYGVDLGDFDYAGPTSLQGRDESFPRGYRWLTSFGVRGCSEGHFVHVAVVYFRHGEQVLETLFLAKTFAGWDAANALVTALNILLDA